MEGIKNYGRYYELNFDDIFQIKIDLNKSNRNEYIIMNLLNTGGTINPLDCSLIYSNRSNQSNVDFGNKIKLSSYKKVSPPSSTQFNITNPDDSVDTYTYNSSLEKFENKEKHLTATAEKDYDSNITSVALLTLDGGEMDLDVGKNYPTLISKGSRQTTFLTSDSISEINNGVVDKLTFTKTNGLVKKISWLKNSVEIYRVNLVYTSSSLTGITIYRVATSGTVQLKNYTLSYSNGITITNVVSGEVVNVLPSTSTTTITRTRGSISLTETISYGTYETIITNALGLKIYYVYDNNNRIVNIIDSSKKVTYTKYDDYLLLEESKPINVLEQTSKSLLTNGFFTNGLNGWNVNWGNPSVINDTTSSNIFSQKVCKMEDTYSISQTLNIEGTMLDAFTLIAKLSNIDSAIRLVKGAIIINFYQDNIFISRESISINENFNSGCYKYFAKSIKAEKSFNKIIISITSTSNYFNIGGVQLLKTDGVVTMSYDSNAMVYKISSGQEDSNIKINDEGKIESGNIGKVVIDKESTTSKEVTYSDYGVKTVVTKDEFEREIKKEITSQNDMFKKTNTYNGDELIDEDDMATNKSYTYESREKLLTKVVNEEGNEITYNYNSKGLISKITQGDNSNSYTYNSNDDLDTYKSYDNDYVDGQLSKVKLNNHELASFSYDNKGRIVSESSQGETTTYSYLNDKVSSVTKNGKTIAYTYDANDKVTNITHDGTSISYQYDENDNVVSEQANQNKIEKNFNSDNEMDSSISTIEDKVVLKSVDLASKKQGKTFASVKRDIYKYPSKLSDGSKVYKTYACFFDKEEQNLISFVPREDKQEDTYFIQPYLKTTINRQVDDYNKVSVGSSNTQSWLLAYKTALQSQSDNFTCAITFDYYKYSAYDNGTVMYFGSMNYKKGSLSVKVSQKSNGIYLGLYACSNNRFYLLSDSVNYQAFEVEIPDDGWNKVGISIKQRTRTDGKYDVELLFMVNDTIIQETRTFDLKFELFGASNHLCFGGVLTTGTVTENVYSGIASLTLTNLEDTSAVMMDKKEMKKLFALKERGRQFDSRIINQSYYQTKAEIRKTTSSLNNNYDFFPLSGTFNSIKGTKPYVLDHGIEDIENSKYFFIFNKETQQYEYEAVGHLLKYKLTSSSGGFTIDVNVQNNGKHQTIFTLKTNGKVYEVFYESGYIKYRMSTGTNSSGEYTYSTSTGFVSSYGKHTIALTYSTSKFNIFVDGTLKKSFSVSGISTPLVLLLGRDEENYFPLEGTISNLVIFNKNLGTTISELTNINKKIVINHLFDKYGRINGEKIKNSSNETVYDRSISYKGYNGYKSNHLSSETISSSTFTDTFTYSYVNPFDKVTSLIGNVTQNIGGTNKATQYIYDSNNRLKEEIIDGTTIGHTYDSRGNILTKGSNSFTYGSSYLDRLEEINGVSVSYDSTNPYKMLEFGTSTSGLSFAYTGKDITSITNKLTNVTTSFTYDSFGRRIKKEIDGANKYTEFIYLDGKLEAEIYKDDNTIYYTLRFLYDENNNLFGFYYNDTPYFYLKNALGTIYGIVDQNKNKVVEYSYDAWGKLLSTTSSNTTISNINPFIYKSYYYDKETGLYWLSSRYYNPDWGRFISPDSIDYLEIESINGLNLFAYCGNDPINKYDPTGHSAESIWKIVGSVAIIAALGVLTIVSAGATSGLLAVAAPIISGAFWGATAGAITGGITGALDAYSSGGSILDGVADGIFSGTLSGAATGAISGAFSYLQFPTSFLNKIDPNIRFLPEMLNIGVQTLGNGVISMTSSLLSGNSIEAAKIAFLFGMAGGFMGANVAGQVAKSVWRSGLDSLGLSASEYLVTQWLGV